MKNKILFSFIVLLVLGFAACQKEKAPNVVGNWYSVANYYKVENGSFAWLTTTGFSYFINFYPDARFNTSDCTPTGGGTYSYNSRAAKIELNYEADRYGNVAGTVSYTIEELTDSRFILSSYAANGSLQFKREYLRFD